MSPSLFDSIRIGLCPERVAFARYGRGLRPKLLAKGMLPLEAGITEEPWRPALAALPKLLQAHAPRAANAVVVLSNHFVRHVLLKPNTGVSSRDEWLAYASHHFEKTYGVRARDWDIQISEAGPAHPRLASAIDKALLDASAAAFKNSRVRLRSVQPYLMTAFNQALPAMRQSAFWFVVQEPGRLQLGMIRDGLWRSMRGRQANAHWSQDLPHMVDRESALLAPEEPCRDVFVSALDPVEPGKADGYQIAVSPSRLTGEDRSYSMVCA